MQKGRTLPLAISIVFCAGCFFYLWLRIDPALYYVAQEPVFQCTAGFLSDYLSYPGGIIDYGSAFLSQFFVFPLAGALIVTILFFLISFATLHIFRLIDGNHAKHAEHGWCTAHLFPPALCVVLQSNYYHPLSITIGFAAALFTFMLFGYLKGRPALARLCAYFFLAIFLYYIAAGVLLLFAALCILYEIVIKRRWIIGVAYGAIAGIVPFFAGEYLFLISLREAYLHLLPFGVIGYRLHALIVILYAFFPALFLIPVYARLSAGSTIFRPLQSSRLSSRKTITIISGVFLTAVLAIAVTLSFSRVDSISLRFCRMSQRGEWDNILSEFAKTWLYNRVANYAVVEALYHAGLLPTELFSIPQQYGERGLFLFGSQNADDFDQEVFFFIYRCELFFKLGLVNEAQQWGYESLALRGETPRSLKRLSQIHALKGEFPAALTCLSILETMPFHKAWAQQFRKEMADSSYDEELREVRRSMPAADFIRKSYVQPCLDLEEAVRQNPVNRMTFEYCMASYLLQGNLPKIASLAGNLDKFGYPAIPRLYEEALVMLKAVDYPHLPAMAGRINQKTFDDYIQLNLILKKYNGNFDAAEKEITGKYWNTYWYYCFYTLPSIAKSAVKKQQ